MRCALALTAGPCRRIAFIIVGITIAALAAMAAAPQGGPPAGPPPAPVRVAAVTSGVVVEHRRVTGELRPIRRSNVATEEAGIVVELPVHEGSRVRAGDMLARLDSKRLEIELRVAEAQMAEMSAVRAERIADAARAASDVEAMRSAGTRYAVNAKELSDAGHARDAAEARRAAAEQMIGASEARLALLRRRLRDMIVPAPFDGVIVGRSSEVGEWAAEGDAIVELVSTGPIEAWLDVPQELHPCVAAIQSAGIEVHIVPLRLARRAASMRIVPLVDSRARTFPLIARIDDDGDDDGGALSPGMSVTAWIPTGAEAAHTLVPRDAITRSAAGTSVFVVRSPPGAPAGTPASAAPVAVEVLFELGDRVAVAAGGVAPGDQVVVEGNERLFPMAPILPMPRK